MSTRKKKSITSLQQIYDSIMELLLKVKPMLDNPKENWRAAVEDLNQVASLAESFSDQRPRSSKSWSHLADSLDQEGVNLWNISGLIGKCEGDDARAHLAALRLAAFRLVEAGLETKPGIESLLHVLQLASKTAVTLSGALDRFNRRSSRNTPCSFTPIRSWK